MYSNKLKKLVKDKSNGSISNILCYNSELKLLLLNETKFLNYNAPIPHRVWYIKNDKFNQVKCPSCDNLSKIDTKYNNPKYCSFSCSVKKINTKTGLTKSQEISIKRTNTMSKIDPKTGTSIYNNTGKKISTSIKEIDPKTGLTKAKLRAQKSLKTINDIDPITKLRIRDKSILKLKKTLSEIDPKTGLTKAKLRGQKALKNNKIKRLNIIQNNFPINFKLLSKIDEYLIQNNNIVKYKCIKCGSIRESYWPYIRCTQCNPYNRSIAENEILNFCKSLNTIPQSNIRYIIPPLELDIYIPNHNLAIEYNGLYWHSSYSVETEKPNYHLYKTEQCKSKGIQLFHIFENEWQDPQKQEIWKSIIRNKLGFSNRIFARKTEVTKITSKDTKAFLDSNHLQSTCVSSVNLGLKLGDELVAIMTFGRSRYDKKVEWELLRYCSKLGTSVVGGASKLLKAFQRDNDGSIISYADKRRSNGNLYEKLGFELSHESAPNYWYWKSEGLESRIGYQKHKLKNKLELFDENLTESENMYTNGYHKIYDCGNQVWKLKLK